MKNAQIKAAQIKKAINTGLHQDKDVMVMDATQVDSYRIMTKAVQNINLLLGLVILGLSGLLLYNINYRVPNDRFFAVAAGAGKMQMVGLRDPYLNTAAVSTWVAMATTSVLTFGFNDMQARFDDNEHFFTPDGWKSFIGAMKRSGLLDIVNNNQQIITAIALSPPEILYNGMRMGKMTWIIDVPMSMTIRAGSKSVTRRTRVRVSLIRMPTAENPMGIGIDTWFSN